MRHSFNSYFELLRLGDARGYLLMVLFGFILARGFLFSLKEILFFWLIIFLISGFGFSINDCFGQKEDRLNKTRKNPIVLNEINFKKGLIFSISLAVLGLFLSLFFGLKFFLLCLAEALLVFFYSVPPLRMKSRPLLDLISHGFFGGAIIFLFPLLFFKTSLTLFHYLIAFSLFYLSIILELRNHLEDCEIDKLFGLKTTVISLGYQKAEKLLRYLAIFYPLILFTIFFLIAQQHLILFSIFTLIFLLLFLFAENYKFVQNYKILDVYAFSSFILILFFNP